jgi:hypothetical protein
MQYNSYEDVIVDYMNRYFAIITDDPSLGQNCYIMKVIENGYASFKTMNYLHFQSKLENKTWNKTKILTIWKNSENRQEYEKVVFNPKLDHGPRELNIYQGLRFSDEECRIAYEGENGEDGKGIEGLEIYLNHLYNVICNKDKTHFLYLICWMASKVVHPEIKLQTMIIIKGMEGVGKGLGIGEYAKIFEPYQTYVNDLKQFTGRFNSMISGKLFAYCDEILSNSKAQYQILKTIITERKRPVEKKFKEIEVEDSFCNMIGTTNLDVALPLDGKQRRFATFECNNEGVLSGKKSDYFKTFVDKMAQHENAAIKALKYYLMNKVNIESFGLGQNIPPGLFSESEQLEGLDDVRKTVHKWLSRGYHLRQNKLVEPASKLRIFQCKTGRIENGRKYDNSWICEIYQQQLYTQYLEDSD